MEIRDKRFNDPFEPDDGFRVLICRLRPRGLSKARETWHEWERALAPSLPLLKAYKSNTLKWADYEVRFLEEMKGVAAQSALTRLKAVLNGGRPVTLLCSSACTNRAHYHRRLVAALLARSEPARE